MPVHSKGKKKGILGMIIHNFSKLGGSDPIPNEYAKENGRVIITLDSDFHAYLAVNNAEAPSVIRIRREGLKALEMSKLIISIWPKIDQAIQRGAMVTVTEESIRVRTLPIYRSDER